MRALAIYAGSATSALTETRTTFPRTRNVWPSVGHNNYFLINLFVHDDTNCNKLSIDIFLLKLRRQITGRFSQVTIFRVQKIVCIHGLHAAMHESYVAKLLKLPSTPK